MVTIPRKRLTVPLAPLIAGGLAVLVALVFALMPADLLGRLALDSGIAALVPAAEPPLGTTARMALVLVGGGGVGLVGWFALYLLIGTRSISISGRERSADAPPVLRRADAHPDAPARRPLFANRDLGTPFLEVRAPVHLALEERDLPADLDQPLASFDPRAIPQTPTDRSPPPISLASAKRPQVFEAGERFETFDLTPKPGLEPFAEADEADRVEDIAGGAAPKASAAAKPEFDASASIHALLDRLEKGVAKPVVAPAPVSVGLQESLASLRRLATSR